MSCDGKETMFNFNDSGKLLKVRLVSTCEQDVYQKKNYDVYKKINLIIENDLNPHLKLWSRYNFYYFFLTIFFIKGVHNFLEQKLITK